MKNFVKTNNFIIYQKDLCNVVHKYKNVILIIKHLMKQKVNIQIHQNLKNKKVGVELMFKL